MGTNYTCGYLATAPGIFKILTIILGGLVLGLGSYSHFESFYIWQVKEEAFISTAAVSFGVSLLYFLVYVGSDSVQKSWCNKIFDFVFHFITGILLIILGGLVIDSTVEIDKKVCQHFPVWPYPVPCQLYTLKLTSSILCAVNGLLYIVTSVLITAAK